MSRPQPELDMSPEACRSRAALNQLVLARQSKQSEEQRQRSRDLQQKLTGEVEPPSIAQQVAQMLGGIRVMKPEELAELDRLEALNRDREKLASQRAFRVAKWAEECPQRYREPWDWDKVDAEADQDELEQILNWEYQEKGLWIVGVTGRSKTRAAFAMLARMYIDHGRKVLWRDGPQFANEAAAAWKNVETTEKWLKPFVDVPLLFLDDLAKKWTPSTEEAAFTIIDRRSSQCRPTIVTLNYTGDELRGFSSDPEVIGPLLRRVNNYFTPIAA